MSIFLRPLPHLSIPLKPASLAPIPLQATCLSFNKITTKFTVSTSSSAPVTPYEVTTLPSEFPEAHEIMNGLRLEYVVAIEGQVNWPSESVNKKMKTGVIEIAAENVQVLNAVKAKLPFLVTTAEELKDSVKEEIRLSLMGRTIVDHQGSKFYAYPMSKKTSLGRQKIEISKIKKKNHLQVTFSKRRSGLFKKTSELCTLCGVEIAIIVFSPAGKVFSFGHPNVESILEKFQNNSTRVPAGEAGSDRNSSDRDLNQALTHISAQLELERKKGEVFSQLRKSAQSHFWWEAPVEEMRMLELKQLRVCLSELRRSVDVVIGVQAEEMTTGNASFDVFQNQFEQKPPGSTDGLTFNSGFGYGNGFY